MNYDQIFLYDYTNCVLIASYSVRILNIQKLRNNLKYNPIDYFL